MRGVELPGCVPREELPAASKCPLWLLEARGLGDGVDEVKVGAPVHGFDWEEEWVCLSGFSLELFKARKVSRGGALGSFWGQAIVEVGDLRTQRQGRWRQLLSDRPQDVRPAAPAELSLL